MEDQPIEILFKIGMYLGGKDLAVYGGLGIRTMEMYMDNQFWMSKASVDFSLTKNEVLSFDLEWLPGRERYIQLGTREGKVYKGSEKFKGTYELIRRASKENNLELMNYFINMSGIEDEPYKREIMRNIFTGACEGGHLDLVKYAVQNGARDLDFRIAAKYNHKHIVEYLLTIENNNTTIVEGAAEGNNTDLLFFLLGKDSLDLTESFQRGMYGASAGGNLDLLKSFDRLYQDTFDTRDSERVLYWSIKSGNREVIDYVVNILAEVLGAMWDEDDILNIYNAVENGDMETVNFLVAKAASVGVVIDYNELLYSGYKGAHLNAIQFVEEHGGVSSKNSMAGIIESLGGAPRELGYGLNQVKRINILKYLLFYNPDLNPSRALFYADGIDDLYVIKMILEAPSFKWIDFGNGLLDIQERIKITKFFGKNVFDLLQKSYDRRDILLN